jgi:hypothetical protein
LTLVASVGCPGGVLVSIVDNEVTIFLHPQNKGTLPFVTGLRVPERLLDTRGVVFVNYEITVTLHFSFVSLARRPDGLVVEESLFVLLLEALSVLGLFHSEKVRVLHFFLVSGLTDLKVVTISGDIVARVVDCFKPNPAIFFALNESSVKLEEVLILLGCSLMKLELVALVAQEVTFLLSGLKRESLRLAGETSDSLPFLEFLRAHSKIIFVRLPALRLVLLTDEEHFLVLKFFEV